MAYKPKIVLEVPLGDQERLAPFVEACLIDRVELIAVVGDGCEQVHDQIDDIIVGNGADDSRFIVTSWHTGETLADALEFAEIFFAQRGDEVELVRL
jgi:hypothetical protein